VDAERVMPDPLPLPIKMPPGVVRLKPSLSIVEVHGVWAPPPAPETIRLFESVASEAALVMLRFTLVSNAPDLIATLLPFVLNWLVLKSEKDGVAANAAIADRPRIGIMIFLRCPIQQKRRRGNQWPSRRKRPV